MLVFVQLREQCFSSYEASIYMSDKVIWRKLRANILAAVFQDREGRDLQRYRRRKQLTRDEISRRGEWVTKVRDERPQLLIVSACIILGLLVKGRVINVNGYCVYMHWYLPFMD